MKSNSAWSRRVSESSISERHASEYTQRSCDTDYYLHWNKPRMREICDILIESCKSTPEHWSVEMGEQTWKSHIHAASEEAAGKVATVTRFKKKSVGVAQHIICQSKAEQHGVNWCGKDFRKGALPFRLCKGSVRRCLLKDQRGKQGFKSCCVDGFNCFWLIYYCIVWMPG